MHIVLRKIRNVTFGIIDKKSMLCQGLCVIYFIKGYSRMKKILFSSIILLVNASAAKFVNPVGFGGSEVEKQNVITYIKEDVKKTYTAIDMGDPMTLRMMEKKNLEAFKKLLQVKNPSLLHNVIKTYCAIDMCNYVTIEMMYRKQSDASKKKLGW